MQATHRQSRVSGEHVQRLTGQVAFSVIGRPNRIDAYTEVHNCSGYDFSDESSDVSINASTAKLAGLCM